MAGNVKRSVSLRVSHSDFERIRAIATRLEVRDSDVFRFAIKLALAKLAPLDDEGARGHALAAMLIDCGRDVAEHFNLDAKRLDRVVNDAATSEAERIDFEDLDMLTMSSIQERYLHARLKQLTREPVDPYRLAETLRHYLARKYLHDGAGVVRLEEQRKNRSGAA